MKEFPENKIDVTVTEKKDKERKERKKIGEICNIQIDSNKYDNIMDMLLLYKLLKTNGTISIICQTAVCGLTRTR